MMRIITVATALARLHAGGRLLRAKPELQGAVRREEARRRGADELHEEVRDRRQGGLRQAAAEKKLAGAAKTSFTKKCVERRRRHLIRVRLAAWRGRRTGRR